MGSYSGRWKCAHIDISNCSTVDRCQECRRLNPVPMCQEEIAELTEEWDSVADGVDCRGLVVDCSNVRLVNSGIFSTLIVLQRRLNRKDAKLVLSGLRAGVRGVLSWTRLDRFFEIKKDEKTESGRTGVNISPLRPSCPASREAGPAAKQQPKAPCRCHSGARGRGKTIGRITTVPPAVSLAASREVSGAEWRGRCRALAASVRFPRVNSRTR